MIFMLHAGRADNCCPTCRNSPCDPCETCCTYPASYDRTVPGGNSAYPDGDLPDFIELTGPGVDAFLGHSAPFLYEGGGYRLLADGNFWTCYKLKPGADPDEEVDVDGSFLLKGFCLNGQLVGPDETGTVTIFEVIDQFADTYVVTAPDGSNTTVTRQDACTWTGGNFELRYQSGYNADTETYDGPFQWQLNDHPKTSPQSSPAGSYPISGDDAYQVA